MTLFKENTLKSHVQLCELRYKALEEKIDNVEKRLHQMEDTVSSIKTTMNTNFADIKLLIEKQSNARTMQLMATIGTIVAAALGALGYYLHG